MNAETLERLLMDRALGGLSAEVDELLDAYLERDAQAAARAGEFAEAARLARHALGGAPATVLPPFPAARIEKLQQARRSLVLVRNIAGLAAALVLGIGVGAAFVKHFAAEELPSVPLVLTHPRQTAEGDSADGFWSARRLYDRVRPSPRVDSVKVIWDSPVERPRLGDVQ